MFLEFRVEICMLLLFLLCFLFHLLRQKSPCVTWGIFEFIVLQPYFSECWDYKSVTACLAGILCLSPKWLPTLGLCPKSTEAIDFALFWSFDRALCWNCLVSQYTSGLWVASWLTVWTAHKLFSENNPLEISSKSIPIYPYSFGQIFLLTAALSTLFRRCLCYRQAFSCNLCVLSYSD